MRDSRISGKERIAHMLRAIADIEAFTKNSSKELFLKDLIMINAVLFQFAIIGEAIIYIDKEMLEKYEYPWHKVRGFRNFILHEYHTIEFRIVWEAVVKDLPGLKRILEQIIVKEFQ